MDEAQLGGFHRVLELNDKDANYSYFELGYRPREADNGNDQDPSASSNLCIKSALERDVSQLHSYCSFNVAKIATCVAQCVLM